MSAGTLYIVGTPIGNLEDITLRALRVLKEAQVIAAEDTRQTRKLLHHYGIATPLISYHEHNERSRTEELIGRVQAGEVVAVVTDAGMPLISDPGQHLVAQAVAAGVEVVVVPGPTAAITGLVASGLPAGSFTFIGFLPRKGKERRAELAALRVERRTAILYESPHRLLETLADLAEQLGARPMAACRELTKKFEEVRRGTAAELLDHFRAHPPRGEFTLVVAGAQAGPAAEAAADAELAGPERLVAAVAELEASGTDRKAAMKEVARRFGLSKSDVYRAVLQADHFTSQ